MRHVKWKVILFLICLGFLVSCRTTPTLIPEPTSSPTMQVTPFTSPSPSPLPITPSQTIPSEEPVDTVTSTPLPALVGKLPVDIGPFTMLDEEDIQPLFVIEELLQGPDGSMWVLGQGLMKQARNGSWIHHGNIQGLPLGFDTSGRLWVVDEEGEWISSYDGETWREYGPGEGWIPAGPMYDSGMYASISDGVVMDAAGDSWLVTMNDVRVLHDHYWTIYTPEDVGFVPSDFMKQEGFGFFLTDVALDASGDIWVTDCAWMGPGPQGQGARWYDGHRWSGEGSPVVASGCIRDVQIDSDGQIWVGVDDDLWRYTSGEGWHKFSHPEHFPIDTMRWGWIYDILLDGTDAAWVSMVPCGGASCDTGQSITFWVSETEWLIIGENATPDVALGLYDLTWGCFGNGLYAVAAGEFIPVAVDLPAVCQVEADTTGRVWLSLDGESSLWVFTAQ